MPEKLTPEGTGPQRPSTPGPSRTSLTGPTAPPCPVDPHHRASPSQDGDTRIMLHMLLSEARAFHEQRRLSLRRPVTPARPAPELGASPGFPPAAAAAAATNMSDLSNLSNGSHLSAHADQWRPTPLCSPEVPLTNAAVAALVDSVRSDDVPAELLAPATSTDDDAVCDAEVSAALPVSAAAAAAAASAAATLEPLPTLAPHPSDAGAAGAVLPSPDLVAAADDDDYDGWADLQAQLEGLWNEPARGESAAQRYVRLKTYLTWLFIWDAGRDWDDFEEVSARASLDWIQARQTARLRALPPGRLFTPPPTSAFGSEQS